MLVDAATRLRDAWGCLLILTTLGQHASGANIYYGRPSNYTQLLHQLRAGDTLYLAPGHYRDGLSVWNLHGTSAAPIRITAQFERRRPVFLARAGHNTISIGNSQYVELQQLNIDGRGLSVDGVKCEGHAEYAHHISLLGLRITGHGADQQLVGISTKCPAWAWLVRGNEIIAAGTGMYFGEADGSAPFFNGIIEHNVIRATRGYALQIKHQYSRRQLRARPQPQTTIIRHNEFLNGSASANAPRPSVLLGDWPPRGPGSEDRYLVYANAFIHNRAEALLQAEGRVAIYNNIFVNRHGDALVLKPHRGRVREVRILFNTIVARRTGVRIRMTATRSPDTWYFGRNIIAARVPIKGPTGRQNVTTDFHGRLNLLGRDLQPRRPLRPWTPLRRARYADLVDLERDCSGAPRPLRHPGTYSARRRQQALSHPLCRTQLTN